MVNKALDPSFRWNDTDDGMRKQSEASPTKIGTGARFPKSFLRVRTLSPAPLPTGEGKSILQGFGFQLSFSVGRSSQRHSAGRKMIAANMFIRNMKVSMMPMSAWNFRSDQIHSATPTASVNAV